MAIAYLACRSYIPTCMHELPAYRNCMEELPTYLHAVATFLPAGRSYIPSWMQKLPTYLNAGAIFLPAS